ncbi:MAG TPA: glycosyltransferase [Candidatus Binataceae bacterium]|nr:glycosyltransferase [Candidatus Binataceae bacterium]
MYIDAGGGHRASATALKVVIERQGRPWQSVLVNLRDVLGPRDPIHSWTGIRIENFYNELLKRGITIGNGMMLRLGQAIIGFTHQSLVDSFAHYWRKLQPDLVVSLIPNFNRAMLEGLRVADRLLSRASTPLVTILTDLADCPPRFWIEHHEQYLVCGTEAAARQATLAGHPENRIFRTSGMIVRPEFYEEPNFDRRRERERLGLDPDLPTGLVMFGGCGSRQMLTIAKRLAAAGLPTQIIFVCGRNDGLATKLKQVRMPSRSAVEGFRPDMARLMPLADFYIGKPGPGSISEALVMGLPVIVERNAWTMLQERFNTDWVADNELGLVLRSFSDVVLGVEMMSNPLRLAHFRSRVASLRNRAVFEIPEILATLVSASACPAPL